MYGATLANAYSFQLAFIQVFSMRHLKVTFSLKNTPGNFLFREFLMTTFPTSIPLFSLSLNI